MTEEKIIITYDREAELAKIKNNLPDNSLVIESNRQQAEIFIRSQACKHIDWANLFRILKELDPSYRVKEGDYAPALEHLYKLWDSKHKPSV